MSKLSISQELVDQVISFHGHLCPGLAIGIRAGDWILNEIGTAPDEGLVLITETDMCGVDALQFLTGCTFGKGNLVYRDYGKVAFSFFRRRDDKKVRLVSRNTITEDLKKQQETLDPKDTEGRKQLRSAMVDRILNAEIQEVFSFGLPLEEVPHRARIHKSAPCALCHEYVMEPRLKTLNGQQVCIPCYEAQNAR
ncbi:MAG: TraR/DksA C4-type zinc finger protein [Thermoguttaceae bacterium]|nr:TraR/DksA C4-type zinc finger protein [Thermoguttaceae bacterium]